MKSQVIPQTGPNEFLSIAVVGFGHTDVGLPKMQIIINGRIGHEFVKRIGWWFDQEGLMVDQLAAIRLDKVWEGECAKMGLTP